VVEDPHPLEVAEAVEDPHLLKVVEAVEGHHPPEEEEEPRIHPLVDKEQCLPYQIQMSK